VASSFTDYILSGHAEPITGIRPLLVAIKKIQAHDNQGLESPSVYSYPVCGSLHKELTKLCIKAKCYQHALQVIERPTIAFKKATQPMDVLSYLYYKGLIFVGLKRYTDASEQFRLVLSYPTQILHKVHSESYKKLILLTLIKVASGEIPTSQAGTHIKQLLPKDFNQMLKQPLEQTCLAYFSLGESFLARDNPQIFEQELSHKEERFRADRNWGLVKKVAKVYRQPLKLRLVELADTYLTVKNTEVDTAAYGEQPGTKGDAKALEPTLFQMITLGQIKAKIDAKQQMISFIDTSATQSGEEANTYFSVVE
jgi:COP9 signalosome complex subunit 3